MKVNSVIKKILPVCQRNLEDVIGYAFAPSNIALAKYWGKRDEELNLPFTDSLSISLGGKGTQTWISLNDKNHQIMLNGEVVDLKNSFAKRIVDFLNLVRPDESMHFKIQTFSNIPVGAGLASSASGFAALVLACNQFFGWNLSATQLSILARFGSGSASRSIFPNAFVEWHAGVLPDGMDSFAEPLQVVWPEFRVGLLVVSEKQKEISSREAMATTVKTSLLYRAWLESAPHDMTLMEKAIERKDFTALGQLAENNALAMHETMLFAKPPISYSTNETKALRKKISILRGAGLPLYFTQDAGPNLKLLFLSDLEEVVRENFPEVEIIAPFEDRSAAFDFKGLEMPDCAVILVNEEDKPTGLMEKQSAHAKGLCHRAFSIFILRDGKEILLQRRAKDKYHCGGLWTNTCCSHPRHDEPIVVSAAQRLAAEMGIQNIALREVGQFHYTANLDSGLTENEIDHVFLGEYDGQAFKVNPEEVGEYRWISIDELRQVLQENPEDFTPWLKPALEVLRRGLNKQA